MGTKKGQVRKTARRAYDTRQKRRTARGYRIEPVLSHRLRVKRQRKIRVAQIFRSMFFGRNGRTKTEKLDDYNTLEDLLYGWR